MQPRTEQSLCGSQLAMPAMAALLGILSALGPFCVDVYLPSVHDVGQTLNANPADVQQTLSVYLLAFSVMSLWHGAISDAFGRRRVILASLTLFALASLAGTFASRIEHLWLLRGIQGLACCATAVVCPAIIRDCLDGPAAQRLMSRMVIAFSIAPIVAPVIGGLLQYGFGWRSVFLLMAGIGFALVITCKRYLHESLPTDARLPFRPGNLLRAYANTFASPFFVAATTALGCNFSGLFIYLISAPEFLVNQLDTSETGYLWLFGPTMLGLSAGAWLAERLARRHRGGLVLVCGYAVMLGAALANGAICIFLTPSLLWNLLPLALYAMGMSMCTPGLSLSALDLFPEHRAIASASLMFFQSLLNGLVAGVIAPLAWSQPTHLALCMLIFVLIGGTLTILFFRRLPALPPR